MFQILKKNAYFGIGVQSSGERATKSSGIGLSSTAISMFACKPLASAIGKLTLDDDCSDRSSIIAVSVVSPSSSYSFAAFVWVEREKLMNFFFEFLCLIKTYTKNNTKHKNRK